ncbi:MAG: undecaprenyl-diphosphate phosphatase [bacterium]
METPRVILLGVIQGLTEFIPVSSTAHLFLVRDFLNWPDLGLSFDMALHLGTLLALIAYMWRDWYKILVERRDLLLLIIIATIPGAIAGFFLENAAETYFRSPFLMAITLSVFGVILLLVDRWSRHNVSIDNIGIREALIIGISQMFAVIPGVSRSGATLTGAFLCNLKREDSARFSFLLSVPIILGAGGVSFLKIIKGGEVIPIGTVLLGILFSFIFGYLAVHFMLTYLKRHNVTIFTYYRLILSLLIIIFLLNRR